MDILVTRRLTLRPPLDVDIDGLVEGLSNYNVSKMMGPIPHPYNADDAKKWIAKISDSGDSCVYTVHRHNLIGAVAVHERSRLELGYWFAEPYWGKGYATEAVRAVISHAFRVHDAKQISSYFFEENKLSWRVMEKVGFEQVGKSIANCLSRGIELPRVETRLTRERFQSLFGPLDGEVAA